MTNVRRPIHLQLRSPTGTPPSSIMGLSPRALSPATVVVGGDSSHSLPSQILPHLFVGNQEQTNRETVNRLGISYILSLGLLPLISSSVSPTSPTSATSIAAAAATTTANSHRNKHNKHYNHQQQQQYHRYPPHHQISMPSRNSSKDFKIRIRTNAAAAAINNNNNSQTMVPTTPTSGMQPPTVAAAAAAAVNSRDENKGIKQMRWIQCKCINIADSSEQMLSKFFDEAHLFIDEARRRKCNILVHCQAGISRSPTIAIAYLMRVNSLPLQDAYNLVKQCRPQTDPNLSFMGQLMIYEKSLEATNCTTTKTAKQTQQQHQHQQNRKSLAHETKLLP